MDISLLSEVFLAYLVNHLTHYHSPRADVLLARLDPFELTDAEENELFSLMAQRTIDMNERIPPIERLYAKALPLVIAMVRHERGFTVAAVPTKDESNNETTVVIKKIEEPGD